MQAARGTSLSDTETPTDRRPTRRWLLFAAVAAVLYTADQLTKAWAVSGLTGREDRPLVGDLLQLRLAYNSGAAFSLGTQYTVLLSCVAITAALAVVWFSRRIGSSVWAVALGFLMAGVCGNLTDRILRDPSPLRGHVVDFLMLPNWPIFNVADMCINVAAGLILVQAFRGVRLDGNRTTDPAADSDADS
jgi:signal peptidase II